MAKSTNRALQMKQIAAAARGQNIVTKHFADKPTPQLLERHCYEEHPRVWHLAKAIKYLKQEGDGRWQTILEMMTAEERGLARAWSEEIKA